MPAITLKAHYDGQRIVLDEPFELPADSQLMVTVLSSPADPASQERSDWDLLAVESLERACGAHEPEYTLAEQTSRRHRQISAERHERLLQNLCRHLKPK